MAQPNTTRRALLGAATTALAYAGGAAIVGGAAVVASEAKGASPGVSPELRRLLAEVDRATSVARDYSERVLDPAYVRFSDAREVIPHIEVEGVDLTDGGPTRWSTDQDYRVRQARAAVRIKVGPLDGPENERARRYRKAQRQLVAASLRRGRQVQRAMVATGYSAAYDRSEHLDMIAWEATKKAREFPVASVADLAAILNMLEDQGTEHDVTAPVLSAAIRHLAGEAQA